MVKVRAVEKDRYKIYLSRASECAASMEQSFGDKMYFSCLLNAVHCVISASDAFTAYFKEKRHAGEDHREAVSVFLSVDPGNEDVKRNAKRLAEILSIKTGAEYGDDIATRKDAEQAKLAAERFFAFIKSRLPT